MCSTNEALAVKGGTAANKNEAPWAVKLEVTRPSGEVSVCTGAVATDGLILTAAHCLVADPKKCTPFSTYVQRVRVRFARKAIAISRPNGRRIHFHPSARYAKCDGSGLRVEFDLATLRYSTAGPQALPIASGPEIDALRGNGVTLFAAGHYPVRGGTRPSTWVRKSKDGGFFLSHACSVIAALCFESRGSTVMGGDSGGPWVGWVPGFGWKQIAVVSGPNHGTSMGDPAVQSWINSEIATRKGF